MDSKVLSKLAGKYGTPLYVYDGVLIREKYRRFHSAFKRSYPEGKVKVLYAYKANTNLAVCHLLRRAGAGADVVSGGELETAVETVGLRPDDVVYTSNSKTPRELEKALNFGVTINLDSLSELETLSRIALRMKKTARVSFRINPAVNPKTHPKIATGLRESKFGLHIEKDIAFKAYAKSLMCSNINVVGVHSHIGSQITETSGFKDAAGKIMSFALKLKEELSLELEFIDFGGGLGIPYHGEKIIQPKDLASAIMPAIRKGVRKLEYIPELWFEPGRYLVADSGILLARVNSIKETPYKKFANLDAGFNTLVRPAMYGSYHRIRIVGREKTKATETYDIAGNVCETGDVFAKDRKMPKLRENDLIAILDAGAYGFSMASQYNSQPLPMEVLVRGKRVDVIRERSVLQDLYLHQKIPADLRK